MRERKKCQHQLLLPSLLWPLTHAYGLSLLLPMHFLACLELSNGNVFPHPFILTFPNPSPKSPLRSTHIVGPAQTPLCGFAQMLLCILYIFVQRHFGVVERREKVDKVQSVRSFVLPPLRCFKHQGMSLQSYFSGVNGCTDVFFYDHTIRE